MIIEFHWLPQLWNEPFFAVAARVFAKLLATHAVVHIHPNNCCGSVKSAGLEIPRIAEVHPAAQGQTARDGFSHHLSAPARPA